MCVNPLGEYVLGMGLGSSIAAGPMDQPMLLNVQYS